ncbi:hypothetical protein ADT25_14705 [Xanthomonas oryzae]|uniref:Uncharacterized protein n=1 Tax=Xanthomonas oryzae TaxID=347 RepID=A0AAP0ZJH9_9XANT|nr:hypothetical protein ADT25_14705 [Xanthomonas oryzae]QBG85727.1 hypothetical protein EYR27_20500 [Xanthomonas oryzae]
MDTAAAPGPTTYLRPGLAVQWRFVEAWATRPACSANPMTNAVLLNNLDHRDLRVITAHGGA